MIKKRLWVILTLFIFSIPVMNLGEAKEVDVRLAGITMTSETYLLGVGWSNAIKKYLPGVRMIVLAEGGTTKLLRGVVNKQWEIGYIGTAHLECAKKGILLFEKEKEFSKEKYYDPTRVLFSITSGWCNYVVRADSGILEIAQLKNKRVHLGNPGGFGGVMTKGVFKGHGLDIDKGDYEGKYLETSQAMDQLRDKAGLDNALVWGGIPQPLIEQLSTQVPLRLLSMTKEGFSKFQKEFPVGPFTPMVVISPEEIRRAYRGKVINDKPVLAWTIPLMLVVHKDMDEKIVYDIVKVFWSHLEEIKSVSAQLKDISLENSLQNLSAPFHPGALKYYKEIGAIK